VPRQTLDKPITTRAARDRLPISREPYWRSIEATVSVGYRRGATGGTWLVRVLVDGRYRERGSAARTTTLSPTA